MSELTVEIPVSPAADISILSARDENSTTNADIAGKYPALPDALETADRTQPVKLQAKTNRLQDKLTKLREKMKYLQAIKAQFRTQPHGHLSLRDPDARAMTTHSMTGTVMVANKKPFTDCAREPWREGATRRQTGCCRCLDCSLANRQTASNLPKSGLGNWRCALLSQHLKTLVNGSKIDSS